MDEGYNIFGNEAGPSEVPTLVPSFGAPLAGSKPVDPVKGIPGAFESLFEGRDAAHPSVEQILTEVGSRGGPSEYGWHSRESEYHCWHRVRNEHHDKEGRRSKEAWDVGQVTHEFLAEHYACLQEKRDPNEAVAKAERIFEALVLNGFAKTAEVASRLVHGYRSKYGPAGQADPYLVDSEIAAVEKKLYRTLPWGERYSVRIDLLLRKPKGYIIVDHKCLANHGQDWSDGWAMDPQMMGLQWVVAKSMKPVVGFSINGLFKVNPAAFDRRLFAATPHLVRAFLGMLKYKSLERRIAELSGWPPNFAACIGRWGKCRWYNECVNGVKP
jgi:hypothetical protein